MKKDQQTVTIPKKSLRSLLGILRSFVDLEDELEDYLMMQDKQLLKDLRRAKKDYEEGRVMSTEEFRKKYDL